ncbi:hypothetical protein L208DRAFT_545682 [Tricholoma matsutake]|nr:hypothetical protein L208DRAFT_545682 [Tricholoma matsutake 945]
MGGHHHHGHQHQLHLAPLHNLPHQTGWGGRDDNIHKRDRPISFCFCFCFCFLFLSDLTCDPPHAYEHLLVGWFDNCSKVYN